MAAVFFGVSRTDFRISAPGFRFAAWLLLIMAVYLAGAGPAPADGFLEIRDGYFYDQGSEEFFIPHGIAYQIWNPPVYANQTTNQVEYDFREMKRMHVNSLRVELTWSQIETNEGCYDFSKADYLVNLAEELDLKLFMLMGYQYPPGWFKTNYPDRMAYHYDQYLGTTGISDVLNYNCPAAIESYANYVSNLCSRYKDYSCIGGWIVGNEFAYYDLWEPPNDYPNHRFLGFDTNYSLPSYQLFLSNRYNGAIAELNDTWDTSYTSFQEIPMPSEFPADREDQVGTQQSGYTDVLLWRQRTIADFLSAGVGAAKGADTNHLVTYAMVGGIFSGLDANNTCEDARTIVDVCNSNSTPVDFWTINNYPWTVTGSEMRSMDFGIAKYRDTIGLPVMLSECGLSDNDILFNETVYRQKHALAGITWEAIMSGAIGAHIFHWNDRPEFFSYDNVLKREGGFGIVHGSRLVKDVYWNVLDAYRRMDELHIERVLPGSMDPPDDLVTYWSKETDLGFGRYNQELAMIWGAFKRMGLQIGIMDEMEFDADAYTNVQAVFLPRNNQMEPQRLYALQTNLLADGIHIFAESDLPGQYNAYYASNADWYASMESVFGLNVSNAVPGFESGAEFADYDDYRRVHVTTVTNRGLLNTNFSFKTWKVWHGITNIDAEVIATHTGVTNTQDAIPALSVKDHGSAYAAFASLAIGDNGSDAEDSPYWEHTWDVRTMFLDAVFKETFGLNPTITLSGDPYARYVAPDYRTCTNGSVLLSLLNMNGPDHPITNLVVHAPSLLNGRKVENLTRGGIVTNCAGDEITVSISGDEFLLLYVYASDASGDHSIINTNKGKIWFENGQWSAPTRVYPTPEWQGVNVGYDIPVEWDWENVRVAFERVLPDGRRLTYGSSRSNWVAPGCGTTWTRVPIPSADLSDTNYISTPEGGEYVLSAWLEDMGEIHSRTEIPVELYWGVRPVSLPSNILPDTACDITVEWQDIPSYKEEEGSCPVNRARQWPLTNNEDVEQHYSILLELMDAQTNVLLATNTVTINGTAAYTFSVTTPPEAQPGNWWRISLVAEPLTHDFIDSFEDRVPGNNSSWYTNDAPMEVWLWGSYGNGPIWWDEGIGLEPLTDGKQSQFLYFKTRSTVSPDYSGHSYYFNLGETNDYSSYSMRSNIWLSMDLCLQDTNGGGTVDAAIELSMMDVNNGKKIRHMTYTNHGGFQTFSTRLSDITSNPPWPGNPINWSLVSGFTLNAKHLNANTAYACFLDNVRLTGTPVRVGTGGMTNGIYMSNGDHLPGPDPDRAPTVHICYTNSAPVLHDAAAAVSNGTDFGVCGLGAVRTNYYSMTVDYGQDMPVTGVTTSGPGAYSYRLVDMPSNFTHNAAVSNFAIVFTATWMGQREAALTLDCDGNEFVIHLDAQVFGISGDNGPAAGGNELVITNLNLGGTLTNVTAGGTVAGIAGQGDDWVRLVMPAHAPGWVDLVLQTDDGQAQSLAQVYQYNETGRIGYAYYGPYVWTNLGDGLDNVCYALLCHTNGLLYAGGYFRNAGGTSANRMAQWDGTNWSEVGGGLNNTVWALEQGPDGEVYVGGDFSIAGGQFITRMAMWDGVNWTNMGDGFNDNVLALACDTNGNVYAGGSFTNSGSQAVNRVAMWNGSAWTNLGEGMNNAVYALDIGPDGRLYASGIFSEADGESAECIAVWDGTAWSNVGVGFNSTVYGLHVADNGTIYAGGQFTRYGDNALVNRLAVWNGEHWTNVGSGAENTVRAIVGDGRYGAVIGGYFTSIDGQAFRRIARMEMTDLYTVDDGFDYNVFSMARGADDSLYAGGSFQKVGTLPAVRAAKRYRPEINLPGVAPDRGTTFGGTTVTIDGLNIGNGSDITNVTVCGYPVAALISQNTTQVVVETSAGDAGTGDVAVYSTHYGATVKSNAFTYVAPGIRVMGTNRTEIADGADPTPAAGTEFAGCAPSAAMTNTFEIINPSTNALTVSGVTTGGANTAHFTVVDFPGTVASEATGLLAVAFGPTNGARKEAALSIAYEATNFVLNVAGRGAYALSAYAGPCAGGSELVITNLALSAGDTVTNVLMGAMAAVIEDFGTNWVRVTTPPCTTGRVDICIQAELTGEIRLSSAYRYNPSGQIGWMEYGPYRWWKMNEGCDDVVRALAVNTNGLLYAGGSFSTADSQTVNRVACWDGTGWTNPASGMNSTVYTLAYDTNGLLYAGGSFSYAGGHSARRVACWDGVNWTNLGAGIDGTVYSLKAGPGGLLYAGGYFTEAGTATANRVAAWNGSTWSNLGSGMNSTVYALTLDSSGTLYAAGLFSIADSNSVSRIAMWDGMHWTNMGSGLNSTVYALEAGTNGEVYAGGNFTTAGGESASRVAMWKDGVWTNLGEGLGDYVRTLHFGADGLLYAGGYFEEAGDAGAMHVARWDGQQWQHMGEGVTRSSQCYVLSMVQGPNGSVYAGGRFDASGTNPMNNVARWAPEWTADIVGVQATNGPVTGDATVTIRGTNLGSGADITNVTLCGISVDSMVSQSATQVVVITATNVPAAGDVCVYSETFGCTVRSNAYAYVDAADVHMTNLVQVFSGASCGVTVTTDPSGLTVDVTYDGASHVPVGAGCYTVTGQVSESGYYGVQVATLTVERATQAIAFAAMADQVVTNRLGLNATADSGFRVRFEVAQGPAQLGALTNLSFSSRGQVVLLASQPGNENWWAAVPVSNAFRVYGLCTVTVASAYGCEGLTNGLQVLVEDTVVTNRVTTPQTVGTTQFVVAGWSMSGNDPMAGSNTSFVMTVTNRAVLNWQWMTNFYLTTTAGLHGTVLPSSGWQTNGAVVDLSAQPNAYYHFDLWSGSVPAGQENVNPLPISMTGACAFTAGFAENLTTNHPTPEWWLADFGWTNDFENAATNDVDGDRVPAWQEYISDTCPTDGRSYLRLTDITGGAVTWAGGTAVVQYLEWSPNFTGGVWTVLATNYPPTAITNLLGVDQTPGTGCYRIRVER